MVTRHVDLFWNVDFETQTLSGEAVLHFDIIAKEIENIVRTLWNIIMNISQKLDLYCLLRFIFFINFFYNFQEQNNKMLFLCLI